MANNHEEGVSSIGRDHGGLWSCYLIVPGAYELAAFRLLVPSDCRVPRGWKISAGGYAIPLLPVSIDLESAIRRRHDELLEEDHLDPNFPDDFEIWLAILSDERLAASDAFEGPVHTVLYNWVGRHAWWNGRSYREVTTALRAGCQVPVSCDFSALIRPKTYL
jgi:hypothetical protein